MKKLANKKLFSLISLLFIFVFIFDVLGTPKTSASPNYLNNSYLAITIKIWKPPPIVTISHYINWGSGDLTWQNFYNMGQLAGQSVNSGFHSYLILQFGEPWFENGIYKVLDYDYLLPISIADIEYYVKAYLYGFYQNSPADVFLVVSIGITNEGPYFSEPNNPEGFGRAWGTMITNITDWIEWPPSYADKLGVAGGIDNELLWSTPGEAINWRNGFLVESSRPYLYYGECNSCPYYEHQDWTPPRGWTLENVYAMSSETGGFALPQIYRKDNQHSEQWYYLSLYKYLQVGEPIGFMGSLTESSACLERDGCNSGLPDAIDNLPGEGWLELWGRIMSDPRTSYINGFRIEMPVSTDISWNPWKVVYSP